MGTTSLQPSASARHFLECLKALVVKEREYEYESIGRLLRSTSPSYLQEVGLALGKLELSEIRTGLEGRCVVTLRLSRGAEIPASTFSPGDNVEIRVKGASSLRGVLSKLRDKAVEIALEEKEEADSLFNTDLLLVKLPSDITFKRMLRGLQEVESVMDTEHLVQVLLQIAKPSDVIQTVITAWYSSKLDDSQKEAVSLAVGSPDIALIHGPPGTGKTSTLVEVIKQLAGKGNRLLVCGPSNLSVDNLVERLSGHRIPMVRLGHPARATPAAALHSLDYIFRHSDAFGVARDIRKEMDSLLTEGKTAKSRAARRKAFSEHRELRKELRQREGKAVDETLKSSQIVFTTLAGAGQGRIRALEKFDVVIIDEAAQALEPECLTAALRGKKLILAGDHLQLPPTVKSSEVDKFRFGSPARWEDLALEYTLFDRILACEFGPFFKRLLRVQYRSHKAIMDHSSRCLYEDQLEASSSNAEITLKDFGYVTDTDTASETVVWCDTSGTGMFESEGEVKDGKGFGALDGTSKFNRHEADLVEAHVQTLLNSGVLESQIAVITPYVAQVKLLRNQLPRGVEVGTVDSFQGRENEAVLVSLVRSNENHEVGFLRNVRRLNVAITRAKRHLWIVGDPETVDRVEFLRTLYEHVSACGLICPPDWGML